MSVKEIYEKLKDNSSYLPLILVVLIFGLPIILGFVLGFLYFFADGMQLGECIETNNNFIMIICYVLNFFLQGFISSIFLALPIGTFFLGLILAMSGGYIILAFLSQIILKKKLINDDLVDNFFTYMVLGLFFTGGIGFALLAFSIKYHDRFLSEITKQISVIFY